MAEIYLIGMPGAGKTVTAAALAGKLKKNWVDLDLEIEKESGMRIPDIFSRKGEDFFRELEGKCLETAAGQPDIVIATGGGIVLRDENVELMKKTGQVFYLRTGLATLMSRVHGGDRPLLAGKDPENALRKLLEHRRPLYEAAADQVFDTDGRTPAAMAEEIAARVRAET